jgi:hypothetical protein
LISRTYATIGEYAKALQYAETAVKDDKTDRPLSRQLRRHVLPQFQIPEAVEQLKLAVKAGRPRMVSRSRAWP